MTARALGQSPASFGWRRIGTLAVQAKPGEVAAAGTEAEAAVALLPDALPYVPQVSARQAAHFYALDYREVGRLIYAPQRDACDAAWRGVAALLAGLWAEDAAAASESESAK